MLTARGGCYDAQGVYLFGWSCKQCRAAVTLRSARAHACGHARRAIFEGGLLQGFDWIAWSVVGLQVP